MLSQYPQRAILSVILLSAIVFIAGCKGSSTSGSTNVVNPSGPKAPEDVSSAAPKYTLKAEEFAAEVKKDTKAAVAKYKDAVIEISATVLAEGKNASNEPYVTLKVPNSFLGVMCFTAAKEPWAAVLPDQTVKLKGKGSEYQMNDGVLLNCVFVDSGKQPPTVNAEAFAKEYVADRSAAAKKYHDKWMIVEGELVETGENKQGVSMLWLKGAGKTRVACAIGADDKKALEGLKPGAKVKLAAQASLLALPDDEPSFNRSLLITGAK